MLKEAKKGQSVAGPDHARRYMVADATAPDSPATDDDEAPSEIDAYELVDILAPLEKSGFWDGVESTKWSEREQAVAKLTKLASTKNIAPGDYSGICRTLKKLITDVNIAVAVEAIRALENLATGLRTHFSGSCRFLLPVLLEKLKEKKPKLTEALNQTLQAMHKAGCLGLADILEEIKTAVRNKVPLVRSSTLNWVTYCIDTSGKAVILKVHKDYVPICMECMNDETPDVRDAAFSALAAVVKLVGMRPLESSIEKLDGVRRKKLSEMISGTEAGISTATASGMTQVSGPVSSTETSEAFVRRSATSMLKGKRPVQTAPAGNVKVGGNMKTSKLVETPEDVEPSEMGLEEIESRLGSLIQGDSISLLKSAVWTERFYALFSIRLQVEALPDIGPWVELLVRLLCALPGWSEKNAKVQQLAISLITRIASIAPNFPKKCVVLCLLGLSERVADFKTRAHAMKCLSSFSKAVGPDFIFERLYKIMKEHKNPKVLSEGLLWMVSAIEDFGISHLNIKDLIEFCEETGLQSSVAATRNTTVKLLGVVRKFVERPDLHRRPLADWNEALDIISFGLPEQSVEAMELVRRELAKATSDRMGELVKDADRLVSCLANKVGNTFDFILTGGSSRACKNVLITLTQTFEKKRLAYAVKESTLESLITELLLWLLDERVPHMDDGSRILRALNVLMLKILDNADPTSSFVVLIILLCPSRWPSNETFAVRSHEFSDLVVKWLSMLKALQSAICDVDMDRILQSIDFFMEDIGRGALADDKPLTLVKTVLHELRESAAN